MMAPAVGKLRESAMPGQGANNLKQIGLALHNYHDANGGHAAGRDRGQERQAAA